MQQGERNSGAVLGTTPDGRLSKALYTPLLQSKDNRSKSVVTWSVTVTRQEGPFFSAFSLSGIS